MQVRISILNIYEGRKNYRYECFNEKTEFPVDECLRIVFIKQVAIDDNTQHTRTGEDTIQDPFQKSFSNVLDHTTLTQKLFFFSPQSVHVSSSCDTPLA